MSFENGHEAAEKCANKAGEEWKEAAYNYFVDYAKRGEPFLTKEVRDIANLPDPHDNRAWGAIAMRAKRNGVVKSLGYEKTDCVEGSYYTVVWQVPK